MKRKISQITAGSFRRRINNETVTWVNNGSVSWSLKQKQLFIDSMLSDFDTQKIYIHESNSIEDNGNIIDGVQRLTTLHEYYNNKFSLPENDRVILGALVSGCSFSQLKNNLQDMLNSYEFTVITLTKITDEAAVDMRYRLNSSNFSSAHQQPKLSTTHPELKIDDKVNSNPKYITEQPVIDIEKDSSHYNYKTTKLKKLHNPKTKHGKVGAWVKNHKAFKAHDLATSGVCDAPNAIEYYEEFIAYRAFFNSLDHNN